MNCGGLNCSQALHPLTTENRFYMWPKVKFTYSQRNSDFSIRATHHILSPILAACENKFGEKR